MRETLLGIGVCMLCAGTMFIVAGNMQGPPMGNTDVLLGTALALLGCGAILPYLTRT